MGCDRARAFAGRASQGGAGRAPQGCSRRAQPRGAEGD
nr:MAG TPA: hypothetical protein [Caudoviricetes sp.]